ncbi:GCHFR, GFRP: GTP cyclohydrolase 1 feedback regulatory protein, putative [Ixodes scapularis]|uniref:GTP cyclohydrolase 1 feedback regulatory protein n=1 Tax=Ixodes scapularis TaxID=6945 RepID=B7P5G0_IXOSC|nr:GCHFR, GFRP: GTP cyclohydrolase 1 feedback regulatory protein, putative [Ixodes scapularis]|eukprot:XP_002407324.1 GCHFR, GFRP: GTP cyclohydrolase 1 feedback regulatory protein, putative [Ixodes scapularis]
MPYLLVWSQVRGQLPTYLDGSQDPALLKQLGAKVTKPLMVKRATVHTDDSPGSVLNKLEGMGYKVVAVSGNPLGTVWTVHKS